MIIFIRFIEGDLCDDGGGIVFVRRTQGHGEKSAEKLVVGGEEGCGLDIAWDE